MSGSLSTQRLIGALRNASAYNDQHQRAAIELLIAHSDGLWLRRTDFRRVCVHHEGTTNTAWINWSMARVALDEGLCASSTELAVLDFAIDLARDRYRFTAMGRHNAHILATAVCDALGVPLPTQEGAS